MKILKGTTKHEQVIHVPGKHFHFDCGIVANNTYLQSERAVGPSSAVDCCIQRKVNI